MKVYNKLLINVYYHCFNPYTRYNSLTDKIVEILRSPLVTFNTKVAQPEWTSHLREYHQPNVNSSNLTSKNCQTSHGYTRFRFNFRTSFRIFSRKWRVSEESWCGHKFQEISDGSCYKRYQPINVFEEILFWSMTTCWYSKYQEISDFWFILIWKLLVWLFISSQIVLIQLLNDLKYSLLGYWG